MRTVVACQMDKIYKAILGAYCNTLRRDPDSDGMESYVEILKEHNEHEYGEILLSSMARNKELLIYSTKRSDVAKKNQHQYGLLDPEAVYNIEEVSEKFSAKTANNTARNLGDVFRYVVQADEFACMVLFKCPSISFEKSLRQNMIDLHKELTGGMCLSKIIELELGDSPANVWVSVQWAKVIMAHYSCQIRLWMSFLRMTLDTNVDNLLLCLPPKWSHERLSDTVSDVAVVIPCAGNVNLLERSVRHVHSAVPTLGFRVYLVVCSNNNTCISNWCKNNNIVHVSIETKENQGCAVLCNIATILCRESKYVLFLDDDAFIKKDTLFKMYQHMQMNDRVGCCSPVILWPDGNIRECGTRIHDNGRCDQVGCFSKFHEIQEDPPCMSRVCMMVRKQIFDNVGGFDMRHGVHQEDMDMCKKIKKMGMAIEYVPDCYVYHSHTFIGGFMQDGVKSWLKQTQKKNVS